MRKIFIVWLITIWNVSAEFCDKKNLPSQNSNAILKEYCSKNNGSLSDRQCVYKNKTLGYVFKFSRQNYFNFSFHCISLYFFFSVWI